MCILSGPSDVLKTYATSFHAHISCIRKQGKVVWVLSIDHYDFGSIQFSETLISDGYFHIS